MKISVCIFAYNLEKYVSQAIEGVLAQVTNFDYEIVIGEDFSTDATRQIVMGFGKNYPDRIRVLCNERNLGLMNNYVNTINQSRGEYIALLDGDDYWIDSNKLQAQVDFLEANPTYSLCFHDSKIIRTNGGMDKVTCCGRKLKKVVTFQDVICDVHIPTSSLVFRRNALLDFPPKWFEDLRAPDRPLFLLLLSVGPGYYFAEPWGVYRQHLAGCWTRQKYQSRWLIHLQIYKAVNEHFKRQYDGAFCKCGKRVSYTLAMQLIEERKEKQALCYFRKYLVADKGRWFLKPNVYFRVFVFMLYYLRSKYVLSKKPRVRSGRSQ